MGTTAGNATTRNTPAFASATTVSTADELLGSLAAYRPLGVKSFETRIGTSEATVCQVLVIDDDGSWTDLGERPIFWQVVRRQIAAPQTPWVAGRLTQQGQAYVLDPLSDEDTRLVAAALSNLQD